VEEVNREGSEEEKIGRDYARVPHVCPILADVGLFDLSAAGATA
jgi:hypothetical protein